MKKVAVFGNAGGGKPTLGQSLATLTSVPFAIATEQPAVSNR